MLCSIQEQLFQLICTLGINVKQSVFSSLLARFVDATIDGRLEVFELLEINNSVSTDKFDHIFVPC